jgi:hypothetical protein
MEPQWLMSTWILTEKLSKITAQARKINQEIAKEINDFVLVLMYSSTLTLGYDWVAFCWLFGR